MHYCAPCGDTENALSLSIPFHYTNLGNIIRLYLITFELTCLNELQIHFCEFNEKLIIN